MKTQIKSILVPVDFSETSDIALSEAVCLAEESGAELHLLHVMERGRYRFFLSKERGDAFFAGRELIEGAEEKLNNLKRSMGKIKSVVHVTRGVVYNKIMEYAEKMNIDLIVMGTHGTGGYSELFLGSTAQRVVNHSSVPVLTLQQKMKEPAFKSILLPIDNSLHSREKVNLAIKMASLSNAEIHVIGFPDEEDPVSLNKFQIKLDSVSEAIRKVHGRVKVAIVHGKSLAKAAMNYAKKFNCELIVINSGHESRIGGLFRKAFAQQIVNHASIPVLSVKHTHGNYNLETPGYGIS